MNPGVDPRAGNLDYTLAAWAPCMLRMTQHGNDSL